MVNYYKSDLSKIIRYDLFNYSVLHALSKEKIHMFFVLLYLGVSFIVISCSKGEWPRPSVPLKKQREQWQMTKWEILISF